MKNTLQLDNYIFLLILLFLYGTIELTASNVVTVTNQGCNYSVAIPAGWDTIPQTIIKERLQQYNVDLGIYPITQEDYFAGNYALFTFIPTLKSLNQLTFNQIVSDQKNLIHQGEVGNDTLRVRFIQTHSEVKDSTYSIYNRYEIRHNANSFNNCQLLRLTKFGYIMVLAYEKDTEGTIAIEEVSALLSESISIHPDYIYVEPRKKDSV